MKIAKDNIITYAVVVFAALVVAIGARISALTAGVDDFSALVVFWSAIVICIAAYLILHSAIEEGARLFVKKKMPQGIIENTAEEEVSSPVEELEVEPQITIDLENVRKMNAQQYDAKLQQTIEVALNYTQLVLAPYITDSAMEELLYNIKIYATKDDFIKLKPIKVKDLQYYDLFHFGWNIWNHFGIRVRRNQMEVAEFLRIIFPHELRNFDDLESIKKKLKMEETKAMIKICHRLD